MIQSNFLNDLLRTDEEFDIDTRLTEKNARHEKVFSLPISTV